MTTRDPVVPLAALKPCIGETQHLLTPPTAWNESNRMTLLVCECLDLIFLY
jgi:hypothetical protein